MLDRLGHYLQDYGLILRGGFHPADDDPLATEAGTLVLIGNAGSAIWPPFEEQHTPHKDALDIWTKQVLDKAAALFGATAFYPSDGPPYHPFQQWAQQAEGLSPSPLFILMHPEYGLWHAYRGALAFKERLDLPEQERAPSPCNSCKDKPCLTGCPVDAFSSDGYDVAACAAHLRTAAGADCMNHGCAARRACPVGRDYHYTPGHAAFHMKAFVRARGD